MDRQGATEKIGNADRDECFLFVCFLKCDERVAIEMMFSARYNGCQFQEAIDSCHKQFSMNSNISE